MFYKKQITISQKLNFLTERKLFELDKQMSECYDKIVENKDNIEKAEKEYKNHYKESVIKHSKQSIEYFSRRRDFLYLAQQEIKSFSKDIENYI